MRFLDVCALSVAALLSFSSPAFALSGSTALPFAAQYTAPDGTTCVHRGVDVAMNAGAQVASPVEGTVTFAGRIPGPHGGSVMAVTIASGENKVTLLPIEDICVEQGDAVPRGASIGACAENGDPSSNEPHVHMSMRTAGVYVDPAGLLIVPSPAPSADVAPAEQAAGVSEAPAATGSEAVASCATAVPATAMTVATSPQASPHPGGATTVLSASAAAAAVSSVPAATTKAGSVQHAAEIAPGVSVAPASQPSPAVAAGLGRVPAGSPVAAAVAAASRSAAPAVSFAAGHIGLSVAVLAGVLFGAIVLVTRRVLTRTYTGGRGVSDRVGMMLQHLKTGDTLCRLTSCPGPLPSQSQGH